MIILFLLLVWTGWADISSKEYRVNIDKASELNILGKTNVNSFTFEYNPNYLQEDMNVRVESEDNRISFDNAILKLKIKGFDSGNKLMNKDLYDLLNANQYPEVLIDFKSVVPQLKHSPLSSLKVNAKVHLAGEKHNEVIRVKAVQTGDKYHYVGAATLDLTNYCITPPVKFMGLVKVQEELTISFDLHFKVEPNS